MKKIRKKGTTTKRNSLVPRKDPPLTSIEQLTKTRQEINALNRQRAKAMERRIAKYLNGRRVPMSGAAAQYKGDVEIPFINNPGKYIIECKLSGQTDVHNDPCINITFKWFPKLQEEAQYMFAKFGVLIIHYMNDSNDYVFVHENTVRQLIHTYISRYSSTLQLIMQNAQAYDLRGTKRLLKSYLLTNVEIKKRMESFDGIQSMKVILPDAEYYVFLLKDFRILVEHL